MSAAARLRVGVYNQFWPTAGGGEKFAGGIAQALATEHDVELLGHPDVRPAGTVDGRAALGELARRLQLDLSNVRWREVDPSPSAVEAASGDYELFINASYGSVLRNRAPKGIYVVHFPIVAGAAPRGWRRWALRIAGRLAKLTSSTLSRPAWAGGVYAVEPFGPLTHRWTDGDGVLLVQPRRVRRERVTLVLSRLIDPARDAVTVEVRHGDNELASRSIVSPRVSDGPPISFLRFRLPKGRNGPLDLHVRSETHIPEGPQRDRRVLGVSVVAALVGPWRQQILQLVHQPLAVAASDYTFLQTYQRVAANSAFTAKWVRQLWSTDSTLLYPPVSPQPVGEKAPVILHVGRFFPPEAGHSKRQRELVGAFRRLVESGVAPGWSLHLVGGCDVEHREYLETVRREIGDLPVHLHVDAPGSELRELYAQASIYWHATGLGDNPDAHPERMEHFGISTVEAMSAGAVPVAVGLAGQLEVFDDEVEGFHFQHLDGLISRTAELIGDPELLHTMSDAAQRRATRYDEVSFRTRLLALVDDVMSA